VEDAFGRQRDVHDLGEVHLEDGQEEFHGSAADGGGTQPMSNAEYGMKLPNSGRNNSHFTLQTLHFRGTV
jgi:hypothetical protein